MKDDELDRAADPDAIGLCASCLHSRAQDTRRGARFYRCARADEDQDFLRYPPIPVARCSGYEGVDSQSE